MVARRTGALGDLPLALTQRIYLHLLAGELDAAASLVEEIQRATDTTGSDLASYGGVGLAALRGRETETAYLIERTRAEVISRGEGIGLSVLDWAAAVLYNGLGRYEEARDAALGVAAHDLNPSMWIMPEVIEAAVRRGPPRWPRTPANASARSLGPAARTRSWGSHHARRRCSPRGRRRRICTSTRSTGSVEPVSLSISRVLTSCTANGYGVSAGAWMRACSCASRMSDSSTSGWTPSLSGQGSSCWRRASMLASAPSIPPPAHAAGGADLAPRGAGQHQP